MTSKADTQRAILEIPVVGAEWRPSTRIRLNSRVTIGRDEDNDLSFGDSLLSSRHAEIEDQDGCFRITDLGSKNGTFVNDVRIQGGHILESGDIITLGRTSIIFREGDLPNAPGETVHSGIVRAAIMDNDTQRTAQRFVDVSDFLHDDPGLGMVCKVTNALVVHHSLPELFDKVLDAILDSIPAQRTAIFVPEGQPPLPTMKAIRTRGDVDLGPIRTDMVQRVVKGREAFLVRDVFEDTPLRNRTSKDEPIGSVMCAPLWSTPNRDGNGRVLGWVYLDTQSDRAPLTDRDFHILIVLANIVATKIENLRLLEQGRQNQRIADDMRLAAEIQAELLPRSSPPIEGYRVCGSTEPCRTVGGDYFDFDQDGPRLHIALADVSGKGTGAAMLMVALRATVRAHWRESALTEATTRINRTFHQSVPPDKFATLFLARLDATTGELEYVNAGHNHPLLVHPDRRYQQLDVGGTIIGAFPEATYHKATVTLEPGACLLVFSDGISDAWQSHEEADRELVKLILARKPGDPATLRARIFATTRHANDDRTLLIIERLPAYMQG
jgi:serine phosphatase RsbU (regulator of sigma subunit)